MVLMSIRNAFRRGFISEATYLVKLAEAAGDDEIPIVVTVPTAIFTQTPPNGFSDYATGTTTSNYMAGMTWNCSGYDQKSITIENTGGANSLTVYGALRAYPAGISYTEPDATVLTPGDILTIELNFAYAEISTMIKSTTPNFHTTYKISWAGAL